MFSKNAIIGLDLSLKGTGYCVLDGSYQDKPVVETGLLPGREAKTTEEKILRIEEVAEGVMKILARMENPGHIIIEAPAKGQVFQAAAIGEIHGVVKNKIYTTYGVFPYVIEASQIRKAVFGKIERKTSSKILTSGKNKGKIKKFVSYGLIPGKGGKLREATIKDIIGLRLKDMGYEFPDQDQADAFVTAFYLWKYLADKERE